MDQQQQQQPQQEQEGLLHQTHETRSLPVRRTETSLIKDEFNSLRARFDAEMRQMEEDMARFRSQMESSFRSSSTSNSSRKHFRTTKTSTRSVTTNNESGISSTSKKEEASIEPVAEQQLEGAHKTATTKPVAHDDWLEEFANSPMVVSTPGSEEKLLKLRFDVSAYESDKIVVMTFDDRLKVCAKREETSNHKSVSSEYKREFLLPSGVDLDQIRSTLSADGILTVEVPLSSKDNN